MLQTTVKLSPEFRKQTLKASLAIIFFICVYLLVLTLAVALTIICGGVGIYIIYHLPKFIIVLLGAGLISFGLLILAFLIKFIFQKHTNDRSHLIQITEDQEPLLFKMLRNLTAKVGTSMPKKVYLSAEVNASVFYDSSFLSMFMPIKKNLVIGMGLVNSTTLNELEAILAHEFGHFSQKTMKVGSMVYNVNQIIYNMLNEDNGFEKLVNKWAGISQYIAIFVILAFKVITGIQWLLRKLYQVVNLNYMALSREMEFHADAIAASITGYEPLKNSLLRLDFASDAYQSVLDFYDEKFKSNLISPNIYSEQKSLMQIRAVKQKLEIKGGFPMITHDASRKYNKSKLVIRDQWSSHPTLKERIEKMQLHGSVTQTDNFKPATSIFNDPENVMKMVTQHIFSGVEYTGTTIFNTLESFQSTMTERHNQNTFSSLYNGYYDHKGPNPFSMEDSQLSDGTYEPACLFSDEKVDMIYEQIALTGDLNTLKSIKNQDYKVKTFDYAGVKYKQKEAFSLIALLENKLAEVNNAISLNDINIYKYFLALEKRVGSHLRLQKLYESFFTIDKEYDINLQMQNEMYSALSFTNYQTPFGQIRQNFYNMLPQEEAFKAKLLEMTKDIDYEQSLDTQVRENIELYLSTKLRYFEGEAYLSDNLDLLYGALSNFMVLTGKIFINKKRELLDYQAQLEPAKELVG